MCDDAQGDWLHVISGCPHTPRSEDAPWMPDCLRYTVCRRAGFRRQAVDKWTQSPHGGLRMQLLAESKYTRTDGSSIGPKGVRRV